MSFSCVKVPQFCILDVCRQSSNNKHPTCPEGHTETHTRSRACTHRWKFLQACVEFRSAHIKTSKSLRITSMSVAFQTLVLLSDQSQPSYTLVKPKAPKTCKQDLRDFLELFAVLQCRENTGIKATSCQLQAVFIFTSNMSGTVTLQTAGLVPGDQHSTNQ